MDIVPDGFSFHWVSAKADHAYTQYMQNGHIFLFKDQIK
jgi:hypothetical protein